jgi:hypothetical protein
MTSTSATDWDDRYRGADLVWSATPNRWVAEETQQPPVTVDWRMRGRHSTRRTSFDLALSALSETQRRAAVLGQTHR